MIGTGKHEFFTNIEQIIENLTGNLWEAETIRFELLDEWYECQMISEEVYVVYGGIWVRQKECLEGENLIEMDTGLVLFIASRMINMKLSIYIIQFHT